MPTQQKQSPESHHTDSSVLKTEYFGGRASPPSRSWLTPSEATTAIAIAASYDNPLGKSNVSSAADLPSWNADQISRENLMQAAGELGIPLDEMAAAIVAATR